MKKNKAFVTLNDKPLLLHVIERLCGLTREIVVVIGKNDELNEYASILPSKVTLLKDVVAGKGPLVGIFTGMQSINSRYALVLPCDSPFLQRGVLKYLITRAQGADAAIPQWPNGNIEPLHAVYRISSAMPAAETALRKGELFIVDMIKQLDDVVYVSVDEIKKLDRALLTFFNINSEVDLKTAEVLDSKGRFMSGQS